MDRRLTCPSENGECFSDDSMDRNDIASDRLLHNVQFEEYP